MKIHLVMGDEGYHEDRERWPVKAFDDAAAAEKFAKDATEVAHRMRRNLAGRADRRVNKALGVGDDIPLVGGPDVDYDVMEIELGSAEIERQKDLVAQANVEREEEAHESAAVIRKLREEIKEKDLAFARAIWEAHREMKGVVRQRDVEMTANLEHEKAQHVAEAQAFKLKALLKEARYYVETAGDGGQQPTGAAELLAKIDEVLK